LALISFLLLAAWMAAATISLPEASLCRADGELTNRMDGAGSNFWVFDPRGRVTTNVTPAGAALDWKSVSWDDREQLMEKKNDAANDPDNIRQEYKAKVAEWLAVRACQ
jgi:hypothetical protein